MNMTGKIVLACVFASLLAGCTPDTNYTTQPNTFFVEDFVCAWPMPC